MFLWGLILPYKKIWDRIQAGTKWYTRTRLRAYTRTAIFVLTQAHAEHYWGL